MLASGARTAMSLSLRPDFLPYERGLIIIEADGIKILQGTVKYLVASIDIESGSGMSYLPSKQQAEL